MIVAHLTTVHGRMDTRIFFKQCRSLVANGHNVYLLVADGMGDEYKDGVSIIELGGPRDRLNRMLKTTRRLFKKAAKLDADIYHLHDPELIPTGLKLKNLGKKVIFDAHEDVSKQLLSKPYLDPFSARVLSAAISLFEFYACRRFDGIITATPFIRDKFLMINPNTLDINNFPRIGELDSAVPWAEKCNEVCYIGGISAIRGIREIVRACGFLRSNARLNLVGKFSESAVASEVRTYSGWSRVNEFGFLDRSGVRDVLSRSIAGLVLFYPEPNHVNAQPNKMFEYMSAAVPVIASNFPLWKRIIEEAECGVCVSSLDPKTIAAAIDHFIMNPDIARRMGEKGRQAVLNKYNWSIEEKKFLNFYEKLH